MTWTTLPRSEAQNGMAFHRRGSTGEVAIVLLHGVGLRSEAWGAQLETFDGRFGMIAVDLPGHGESRFQAEAASISDYAMLVAEALPVSTKGFVVIGHSMGAMIALEMAALRPETVVGVVALNAVFERSADASAAVQERAAEVAKTREMDVDGPVNRWFPNASDTPAAIACRDWLKSMEIDGYGQAYNLFAHNDGPTPEQLRELRCPALFMTGDLDPNSTPAMSQAMAELAANGTATVIEGAAHMMPMTHGYEVNRHITSFVEQLSGRVA